MLPQYKGQKIGLISFRRSFPSIPPQRQVVLSVEGDLQQAARRLFAGMRRLDELHLDVILAELAPEQGLGRAINDRLRRAAAKGRD